MGFIFRTTKEWWLVSLCLLLLLAQFLPQTIETIYPIIDWKGGNRLSMQVSNDMREGKYYHCGEMVLARFRLQKQREAVGEIQWKLLRSPSDSYAYSYPGRRVSSPIGITDHWAGVERLPEVCSPGQYYFEGTITYPGILGQVIYTIRTECFLVKDK
jgi:hypothetical protein